MNNGFEFVSTNLPLKPDFTFSGLACLDSDSSESKLPRDLVEYIEIRLPMFHRQFRIVPASLLNRVH